MQALYPGCVAPVKSRLTVETDDADFDLSTATGGRIVARFQNGSAATWTAVLSALSATSATLTREHEAADVPAGTEGIAYLHAEIDLPAATEPMISGRAPVLIQKV
jgi:hypothetical protein